MKAARQCLLILSENKETGAKAAISKGSEKRKFEVMGAPTSRLFDDLTLLWVPFN